MCPLQYHMRDGRICNYVNCQNLLHQTVAATSACYEDSADLTVIPSTDNVVLVGWLQRMQSEHHISSVIFAEVFHTALECTRLALVPQPNLSGLAQLFVLAHKC